jgi:signal transduction histidine kinase/CheY-like chemotaxis protein
MAHLGKTFKAARLAVGLLCWAMLISASEIGALMLARYYFGGNLIIWTPEAIVLALMFGRFRNRPWLVLFIGELTIFGTSMLISGSSLGLVVLLLDRISGLREAFIYLFVMRFSGPDSVTRSKGLLIFLGASLVASVFGAAAHALAFNWLYGWSLKRFFVTGLNSSLVGYAVITPLLFILTNIKLARAIKIKDALRSTGFISLYLIFISAIMFQSTFPLLFMIPIALMAVCYTVDLASVAIAVLLTAVITVWFTLIGHGPITLMRGDVSNSLLMLQVFLVVITSTTLPIAALMAEHAQLKRSLLEARVDADAANQAKTTFLANMSHEIRTPLNGVLGMAQVIAMDHLSAVQRERVAVVQRSGEALLSILNDILDLSKIEAGKLSLEAIEFDLGETVRNAAQSYQSLTSNTCVEAILELDGAEGIYIGDPTRVRQILHNLMSNAFKFTREGTVTVAAAYAEGVLRLTVTDTGIGIPADKLSRLFSKFSQVDASTTRKFGGTGLGLSICRELTELMGGTIDVASEDGHGSRFTVYLPMERISDAPNTSVAGDSPSIVGGVYPLRVLAAEDNPTNQLVLNTLLALAGLEAVIVENGAQVLEAWSTQAWDVILMDIQMPVMDGPTAAREIRRREAEQQRPRTPIIALTANTMSYQIAEYLADGMDGHLAKPIEIKALFETLSALEGEAVILKRKV